MRAARVMCAAAAYAVVGERSVASLPWRRRAAATTTPLKIQTPPRVMRMVYDFIYP